MKRVIIIIMGLLLLLGIELIVAFVYRPAALLEETSAIDSKSADELATQGDSLDKVNVIIDTPKPGASVTSPLKISGKIRGNWTFEANAPISIVDWDGKIVGEGHGTTKADWMTTDFVPFEAVVEFTRPVNVTKGTFSEHGTLIFKKDNPSGLPQNDAAVEIPIIFK